MFEIVGREEQVFEQWEQGVKLSNPCMKAGDEVVFRNSSGATYVMIAESGGVEVPNKMLQMTCNILVDLKQGKEQHDDCQTVFEVNPAEKPDDYVYVDNTIRKQEVQSGGGSGGAGDMVVHITMNDSYPWYSADKTFDEISAMIESRMDVMALLGDVTEMCDYMPLTQYISGDSICFCSTNCFVESTNPEFGVSYAVFKPDSLHCGAEPLSRANS